MKQLTIFLILTIISLTSGDNSQILSQTAGSVVDPSSYNVKLVQSDPLVATCTVHPTLSPVDFVILEDTTGSMSSLISVLSGSFSYLFSTLSTAYPGAQFGVAEYKDLTDSFAYRRDIDLSSDLVALQGAIASLAASGGGDLPEAVWDAIVDVALGPTSTTGMSFRNGSRRVLLVFNDAVSHEGGAYKTQMDAINALNAKNIVPIFFTSQVAYYSAFIAQPALGRGAALTITSTPVEFSNTIIDTVGRLLDVVNATIFQTQDYIKSVSPISVPFNTTAPIVFTVNLLAECKNRSRDNIPDYNAYIDLTPGWGHCNFNISVVKCNQEPVCNKAYVDERLLWPPNHKFVNVPIKGVTDPDGDLVTIEITGILQNENTNGGGDGNTCPDGQGVGTSSASVRVERSGNLYGRIYRIAFKATDPSGASCTGFVEVCVPHDQGNDSSCEHAPAATIDSTVCH
jgi:hypothetical protein